MPSNITVVKYCMNDNFLLAVRDINHKYIVVGGNSMNKRKTFTSLALDAIMTVTMSTTAFAAETDI